MDNHMGEVAQMLGVGIGEHFTISGDDREFMISYDGLIWIKGESFGTAPSTQYELLRGGKEIIKKPWKPNIGGCYWSVDGFGNVVKMYYYEESGKIDYKIGNCYKTEAEAIANLDRWKAWYSSDERVDVFNG